MKDSLCLRLWFMKLFNYFKQKFFIIILCILWLPLSFHPRFFCSSFQIIMFSKKKILSVTFSLHNIRIRDIAFNELSAPPNPIPVTRYFITNLFAALLFLMMVLLLLCVAVVVVLIIVRISSAKIKLNEEKNVDGECIKCVYIYAK